MFGLPEKGRTPYGAGGLDFTAFLCLPVCESGRDKAAKQGRRSIRTGLKFRMSLCADEPGMVRQFAHLDNLSVGGKAAETHPVIA